MIVLLRVEETGEFFPRSDELETRPTAGTESVVETDQLIRVPLSFFRNRQCHQLLTDVVFRLYDLDLYYCILVVGAFSFYLSGLEDRVVSASCFD